MFQVHVAACRTLFSGRESCVELPSRVTGHLRIAQCGVFGNVSGRLAAFNCSAYAIAGTTPSARLRRKRKAPARASRLVRWQLVGMMVQAGVILAKVDQTAMFDQSASRTSFRCTTLLHMSPAGDSERDLNTEEEEEAKFKSGDPCV